MSLTDMLGHDDAPWMGDPARNCAIPSDLDTPKAVGQYADRWYPTDGNEARAKPLCNGCPRATQCLTFALERPELDGVWGGTTTTERANMRRRPSERPTIDLPVVERDSCGTVTGYDRHRKGGEHICDDCRDTWNAYRRAWRSGKKDIVA